jgi:hypothetical protein
MKRILLFWAFYIDLKKAYDSVNQNILFKKLAASPVNSFIYNSIVKIYETASSCIWLPTGPSANYRLEIGVWQGCPLSPTLFNIYINELVQQFSDIDDTLAYADDLCAITDSIDKIQLFYKTVQSYCQTHKMTLNLDSGGSKTAISSNGKANIDKQLLLERNILVPYIPKDKSYNYLGIYR